MKKYIKWAFSFLWTSFLIWFFFVAWVIASTQISSFDQTVSEGSIITSEYYNKISSLLKWSKSEGKYCKFSGGKIVCLDDLPIIPEGEENATVMRKSVYYQASSDPDEIVAEWNQLIDETFAKWIVKPHIQWNQPLIDELTSGWYNTCIIKPWKYQLNKHTQANIDWCGYYICEIWKEHWNSTINISHCWNNSQLSCPRATFRITCMY